MRTYRVSIEFGTIIKYIEAQNRSDAILKANIPVGCAFYCDFIRKRELKKLGINDKDIEK